MENNIITNLNETLEDVSLHNYLLDNKAVTILRNLVDHIHWDNMDGRDIVYPYIILFGDPFSARLLARAFSNTLGHNFNEIYCNYGFYDELKKLANDAEYNAYFIGSIENMAPYFETQLYNILTKNELSTYNHMKGEYDKHYISRNMPIIFSAGKDYINLKSPNLLNVIDVKINLEEKSDRELIYLALAQRSKICGWEAEDNALQMISIRCKNNIEKAFEILQMCYYWVRSKGDDTITMEIVRQVLLITKDKVNRQDR